MKGVWAIVPYKEPPFGKSRLSSQLNREQRTTLTTSMLDSVLDALYQADSIEGILLVSESSKLERYTMLENTMVLATMTSTLSAAVTKASSFAIDQLGCTTSFVVPADLPLICPYDIEYAMSQHHEITIIPDAQLKGTNGVISTPPNVFSYVFNGQSFSAHVQNAQSTNRALNTLQIENFSYDVDTYEDLLHVAKLQPKSRIATVLREFVVNELPKAIPVDSR